MAKVTLKQLHTEGRLSLGDILSHDTLGDFELVNVTVDGQLVVKNQKGEGLVWKLDLPSDCQIIQVN